VLVEGLGKQFSSGAEVARAFGELSLQVQDGEFLCLVGPSGCGKTTLLRCIAGIEQPTEGEIKIAGGPAANATPLAMVFQQHGLFPWMTVAGNLRFVLRQSEVEPARHGEIIDHLLGRVGLTRFRRFYPYQLSGGMAQRVALVRAFCVQPRVLLMDEPFVFLDYQNRIILQDLLLELWAEQRQTILFVTHNINEAAAMGDRVMVMPGLPGPFKRELICPFPRPRDVIALRQEPEYQRIVVEITRDLRDEIQRADQHEANA
jgi:NitT/TauT family transport system ATP-binding protein